MSVRLPKATRKRIEDLARAEGRSLSQQVEQLILRAMDAPGSYGTRPSRPLAGMFAGGRVPTLTDFRTVRRDISASLNRSSRKP